MNCTITNYKNVLKYLNWYQNVGCNCEQLYNESLIHNFNQQLKV